MPRRPRDCVPADRFRFFASWPENFLISAGERNRNFFVFFVFFAPLTRWTDTLSLFRHCSLVIHSVFGFQHSSFPHLLFIPSTPPSAEFPWGICCGELRVPDCPEHSNHFREHELRIFSESWTPPNWGTGPADPRDTHAIPARRLPSAVILLELRTRTAQVPKKWTAESGHPTGRCASQRADRRTHCSGGISPRAAG